MACLLTLLVLPLAAVYAAMMLALDLIRLLVEAFTGDDDAEPYRPPLR